MKFREIYQFVVVIAAVDSVDNRRQPYSRGVAAVGGQCGQPKTTRGGFVDGRGGTCGYPHGRVVINRVSHSGVRILKAGCVRS